MGNFTGSMHQLMDDNAKVDATASQRDGLDSTGSAHTATAPVARDDVDVSVLRCSRNEPKIGVII